MSQKGQVKKLPSFMVVPTWCVFQPDMVTVSLQSFWAIFGPFLGPGGPKNSQILSALIRTGLQPPKEMKLKRCIT